MAVDRAVGGQMGMVGQYELFSVEIKMAAAAEVDQWRWLINADGSGGSGA